VRDDPGKIRFVGFTLINALRIFFGKTKDRL